MSELEQYLKDQIISYKKDGEVFLIDGKKYQEVFPTEEGIFFDTNFHFVFTEDVPEDLDFYIYKFGGVYYYTTVGQEKDPKIKKLKYVGKAKQSLKTTSFLGVRGGFELLNGSRLYKDWCEKAKFLGVKNLGICEKNTLAGALKFQLECEKNEINPIIGATYTIFNKKRDLRYDVKCYVENEKGWHNLLDLNKYVNIDNLSFIEEETFYNHIDGLVIVLDPKSLNFEDIPVYGAFDLGAHSNVYFQLDTVEYEMNERDKEYLLNLKKYVNSDIPPVSITDAFYLDKEDSYIKNILNSISNVRENKSHNQYFKNKDDYFFELDGLFNPENERFETIFNEAVNNEKEIVSRCKFKVDTKQRHLPKYTMSEEEKEKYEDNLDMFWGLIEEGLQRINPKTDLNKYIERIDKEVDVIQKGNVVDYFLITYDIIRYCRENEILTGVARGSAGGSLVSFCLGIIHIDPLEFDLLFERFLNEGRVTVSLPDIDSDMPGEKRHLVKSFIEEKYGHDQVCSVGTYTALQLRAAIKDISRHYNIDFGEVNIATSVLEVGDKTVEDLFKKACKKRILKSFINKHPEVIHDLQLVLGQPKAKSIHACAMIIFPKEKSMYHWVPVREQDGMIVSEWEGGELDSAGFLKQDILGIKQLDKYQSILDSIKKIEGDEVNIYKLPLNEKEVYKYFQKGWNGDIFHFGSKGLTSYCKDLKPENIEDLFAAISLYRPGAMENNFHNEYVLRKEGKRDVEYLEGLEKITSETLGIIIYQEQVMQACVQVAGYSLVESDDIRKAMGKKKMSILGKQKPRFIGGSKENGYSEEYAEELWEKLIKFAGYGFNKSHAAAYAVTGYIGQWLKVHYPIHFWSTAINYASEDDIPSYISEINTTGIVKIASPDINKSDTKVNTDFNTNTIYWALSSIKQCGETSTNQIMKEREENGEYFSLDEFLERHSFKGSKVNKRVIENLILSGAFDEIEDVKMPQDRYTLINKFRERNKVKIDEEKDFIDENFVNDEWWWTLQQKRLSGIAFFNYTDMCDVLLDRPYKDPVDFEEETSVNDNAGVGGYVLDVEVKNSKKGSFAKLLIENNYSMINILIWPEQYEQFEEVITDCKKSLLFMTGVVKYDSYGKTNVLQSDSNSQIKVLK
jgi:DNA polymerase-3 subunit alpha